MRKNKKRRITIALAAAMTVLASPAGYAAQEATTDTIATAGAQETELVGTISATQIKVTLPLKAAFDIDPGGYAQATTTTTLNKVVTAQSQNYVIKNESTVPVYVYISKIEAGKKTGSTTQTTKDPVLTTAVSDLDTDLNVMLAIKTGLDGSALKIDEVKNASAFWIPSDLGTGQTKQYFMSTDKAGTNTDKGKIEAAKSITMSIYALTKKGWVDEDVFAVRPTFTVSTKEPS